jgi:prefoldin subunit 5
MSECDDVFVNLKKMMSTNMTDEETIEKLEGKISDLESELQDANDKIESLTSDVQVLKEMIDDEMTSIIKSLEDLQKRVSNY